jgi:hypothetical protein
LTPTTDEHLQIPQNHFIFPRTFVKLLLSSLTSNTTSKFIPKCITAKTKIQ